MATINHLCTPSRKLDFLLFNATMLDTSLWISSPSSATLKTYTVDKEGEKYMFLSNVAERTSFQTLPLWFWLIFNLMLCFNQQIQYVKGQGMYIYGAKNPHVSLVYRKNNLCHCHRLPARPIIHFFRGLKIFRAACLSNKFETSHSWLFLLGVFLS